MADSFIISDSSFICICFQTVRNRWFCFMFERVMVRSFTGKSANLLSVV